MADRKGSGVSASGRKRSVAEEPVTSVLKGGDIPINDSGQDWNPDEEVLAALGYKPEFKRSSLYGRRSASVSPCLDYCLASQQHSSMAWAMLVQQE